MAYIAHAPGGSCYAAPGKGANDIRIACDLRQKNLERAMDLLALGIEVYNISDFSVTGEEVPRLMPGNLFVMFYRSGPTP